MSLTDDLIDLKSIFEPMIDPDTLRHLQSNPKYSQRSYAWAAQQNSPEAYRAWLFQWITDTLNQNQSETLDEVMQKVANMVWMPCFMSVGGSGGEFPTIYRYNGRYWEYAEKGTAERYLRVEIGDHLARVMPDAAITLKRAGSFMRNLILGAFTMTLHIEPFDHWLHPDRTGGFVTNSGTLYLDEDSDNFIVKPSLPDDNAFRHGGVDLDAFSYESPEVIKVLNWLNQIFFDTETTAHFLEHLRGVLTCRPNKALWYGIGSNSKSSMEQLVRTVFDTYVLDDIRSGCHNSRLTIAGEGEDHGYNNAYDIIITNESPDKFHNRAKFHFAGQWIHGGEHTPDPYFYETVPDLAPAFLWILTRPSSEIGHRL